MVPFTKFDNIVIGEKQKLWLKINFVLAGYMYVFKMLLVGTFQ